jgi:hypothetical protein
LGLNLRLSNNNNLIKLQILPINGVVYTKTYAFVTSGLYFCNINFLVTVQYWFKSIATVFSKKNYTKNIRIYKNQKFDLLEIG